MVIAGARGAAPLIATKALPDMSITAAACCPPPPRAIAEHGSLQARGFDGGNGARQEEQSPACFPFILQAPGRIRNQHGTCRCRRKGLGRQTCVCSFASCCECHIAHVTGEHVAIRAPNLMCAAIRMLHICMYSCMHVHACMHAERGMRYGVWDRLKVVKVVRGVEDGMKPPDQVCEDKSERNSE